MLGRRNLRVKVMQALYGWEMDRESPLTKFESHLQGQIQKSVALYLTDLLYLVEVCQYSMVDKAKRLAKFIKTEEDEKASTTIAANAIVKYLLDSATFNSFIKNEGIRNYVNEETVKSLFKELSSRAKYKEYAAITNPTLEQDKEIVAYILKKVFGTVKDLEQQLEESFLNFHDDNGLILHLLGKYVDAFQPDAANNFFQTMDVWEEEKKFALDLLAKTVQQNDELTAYIEPCLKNWEMERVAILDLIMLKMGACELKYFPTIPVKVTMNEYIEISKMYSTPKSKDFVNGVLDRMKSMMVEKNDIKKYGRGLME